MSEKLSEYNLNFPVFSEIYINKTLKTIEQKAGINNVIPQQITRGGAKQTEMEEKWRMITIHIARRSLVSLGTTKLLYNKSQKLLDKLGK